MKIFIYSPVYRGVNFKEFSKVLLDNEPKIHEFRTSGSGGLEDVEFLLKSTEVINYIPYYGFNNRDLMTTSSELRVIKKTTEGREILESILGGEPNKKYEKYSYRLIAGVLGESQSAEPVDLVILNNLSPLVKSNTTSAMLERLCKMRNIKVVNLAKKNWKNNLNNILKQNH